VITTYQACIPPTVHALTALTDILVKAQAHCAERAIEPAVLMQSRLFPDMLPLVRQVQIATDIARRFGARMVGDTAPAAPDTETDFEQLKARLASTIAYLETFKLAQFEGAEKRDIAIPNKGGERHMDGLSYAQLFALPNIYFHVTTTYAILRHNGVEIGKMDFLGKLPG
jgi:hypothetical protein